VGPPANFQNATNTLFSPLRGHVCPISHRWLPVEGLPKGIIRVVDLFEVIKRRRSVRAFARQAVEAERVAKVLAAANAAPSAGNLQGYEIFRVTPEKERVALAHAALYQFLIAQAPVVLVFCANQARSAAKYRKRGARLYAIQDAMIACAFAMLPVAILPIGYPAEEPKPTPRHEVVRPDVPAGETGVSRMSGVPR
jgi:nitroreductase